MKINSISVNYLNRNTANGHQKNNPSNNIKGQMLPNKNFVGGGTLSRIYINNISFSAQEMQSKRVTDIDYFKYKNMSPHMKKILRKKCVEFNKDVNASELHNDEKINLPLMNDKVMKDFIKVCDLYRELKNEPILCLGRSPKWFLNTALWMKDGIEDYKFVAFSKNWYRTDKYGLVRMDRYAPTPEEKKAYKRYLKSIQADPKHIVDVHNKTGKKIVITDYIDSGKGACSFLDLMSEYAEEDGILEEFANSIRIFGIGCLEHTEKRFYDDEEISIQAFNCLIG